jgi:DNA helicase-2/ATP-dependent DNA helicase PcrA
MHLDLSRLDAPKLRAVTITEQPLLIIAGPGAGKTMALVERTLYLLVEKEVKAEHVLIATFTEKAAAELVTRISNRAVELGTDVNISELYIGTLHSIFLRLLKEYRHRSSLKRNYRVLDEFEQKYLIHRNLSKFHAAEHYDSLITKSSSHWEQAETIAELVNKTAEEALEIGRLLDSESEELRALGAMTEKYRNLLSEENALDFSTIQSAFWELIQSQPDVLADIRGKIHYLMIDEYQDTNTIQEKILLEIAAPGNRICVVGDDDQSLYRFRGATVRNILEFQTRFDPGACEKIELVVNYRSHPGIIDFYNRWMETIPDAASWEGDDGTFYRYPKVISPREIDFPDYPSVVKAAGDVTPESWHGEVFDLISALKDRGVLKDHNQIAFLFNSVKGAKVISLADYLESRGIPVFSPRSALFFLRDEIRLLLGAYIFMFPKLIETYLKWNSDAHLPEWDYYEECLHLFTETLRSDPAKYKRLRLFCAAKAKIHTGLVGSADYGFTDILYNLLEFPPFSRYVDVELDTGVHDLRPAYNIALFSRLLSRFEFLHNIIVITKKNLAKDLQSLFNRYLRFLIDGGLGEYEDIDTYAPSGCVSFMTIHQSKGLEFPVVFVGSLNNVPRKTEEAVDLALENHYRRERPFEPADRIKFFDFWRLYYTAFSRAQNLLVLTGTENPSGKGRARLPSRYFSGVYPRLPSWRDAGLSTENLVLEAIKPVDLKHDYSFTSHILMYENCPLQYKFFREMDFSPVRTNAVLFGTLVHQTIEDAHKAVLAGRPESVTSEQIALWLNANYASLSKATRTYLAPPVLRAVEEHILRYVNFASSDWGAVRDAEVTVSLLKPAYILSGTVDLIRGKNNTVDILDFKTEKKPDVNDPEDREKLDRYRRQLEVYAHVVEERYGLEVGRMLLFYTGAENESPFISYDYEKRNIYRTVAAIEAVVNRIEDKNFDHRHIKKTHNLCGHCDVKPFCWRESPEGEA